MSDQVHRRRFLGHAICLGIGGVVGYGVSSGFSLLDGPGLAAEDGDETPEGRLKKLKLTLPPPRTPPKTATLVPAVLTGDILYVSGHTPVGSDGKSIVGKVGKDLDVKQARAAARLIGLTVLSVVKAELGSLNRVVRLVKTLGMVNCTPEFTQQPAVINGFSDLMVEIFGDKAGKGARSAVGMGSLPGGVAVEIECIFQVKK